MISTNVECRTWTFQMQYTTNIHRSKTLYDMNIIKIEKRFERSHCFAAAWLTLGDHISPFWCAFSELAYPFRNIVYTNRRM